MAELKYKVGDKVRIKPKFHFCKVDAFNNIHMRDGFFNEYSRLPYCETVMTIGIVNKDFYILKEDRWAYKWTDEMIECKVVDDETKPIDFTIKATDTKGKVEVVIPEGYKYVVENDKLYFISKKKAYPQTYEECCKVLDFCGEYFFTTYEKGIHLLENDNIVKIHQTLKSVSILTKLLICRDAYWKIAGEEMGLAGPWKPDWDNVSDKYCIYFVSGYAWSKECQTRQCPFAFPTPEMRNSFYENFKEEIEKCKELL